MLFEIRTGCFHAPVELVLVTCWLDLVEENIPMAFVGLEGGLTPSPAFKGSGRKKKVKGAVCTAAKGTVVFIEILGGKR